MNWQSVKLREVLSPCERVEAVEPSKSYRLLGVRLEGNGAFHRETKLGSVISAKRLDRVQQGDFIYSRLFAWRGAFAIVGPDLDGAFVSSEFPLFRVDECRLMPDYLLRWFSLPATLSKVEEDCIGSTPLTRNRFKEEFFLGLQIPLPPIEEQRKIMARLDGVSARLKRVRSLDGSNEQAIEGILASVYAKIVQGAEMVPLSELAPLTRRPAAIDPRSSYPQVSVRSFGRGTFHKPPLDGASITWEKPHLVRSGDVVISNIKAWEGAIAVARPHDDGRYGSHRYLTLTPADGHATASFIAYHLLTTEGLLAIGEASPGTADRNRTLSAKALMSITIPAPSFSDQCYFEKIYMRSLACRDLRQQRQPLLDAVIPAVVRSIFVG